MKIYRFASSEYEINRFMQEGFQMTPGTLVVRQPVKSQTKTQAERGSVRTVFQHESPEFACQMEKDEK